MKQLKIFEGKDVSSEPIMTKQKKARVVSPGGKAGVKTDENSAKELTKLPDPDPTHTSIIGDASFRNAWMKEVTMKALNSMVTDRLKSGVRGNKLLQDWEASAFGVNFEDIAEKHDSKMPLSITNDECTWAQGAMRIFNHFDKDMSRIESALLEVWNLEKIKGRTGREKVETWSLLRFSHSIACQDPVVLFDIDEEVLDVDGPFGNTFWNKETWSNPTLMVPSSPLAMIWMSASTLLCHPWIWIDTDPNVAVYFAELQKKKQQVRASKAKKRLEAKKQAQTNKTRARKREEISDNNEADEEDNDRSQAPVAPGSPNKLGVRFQTREEKEDQEFEENKMQDDDSYEDFKDSVQDETMTDEGQSDKTSKSRDVAASEVSTSVEQSSSTADKLETGDSSDAASDTNVNKNGKGTISSFFSPRSKSNNVGKTKVVQISPLEISKRKNETLGVKPGNNTTDDIVESDVGQSEEESEGQDDSKHSGPSDNENESDDESDEEEESSDEEEELGEDIDEQSDNEGKSPDSPPKLSRSGAEQISNMQDKTVENEPDPYSELQATGDIVRRNSLGLFDEQTAQSMEKESTNGEKMDLSDADVQVVKIVQPSDNTNMEVDTYAAAAAKPIRGKIIPESQKVQNLIQPKMDGLPVPNHCIFYLCFCFMWNGPSAGTTIGKKFISVLHAFFNALFQTQFHFKILPLADDRCKNQKLWVTNSERTKHLMSHWYQVKNYLDMNYGSADWLTSQSKSTGLKYVRTRIRFAFDDTIAGAMATIGGILEEEGGWIKESPLQRGRIAIIGSLPFLPPMMSPEMIAFALMKHFGFLWPIALVWEWVSAPAAVGSSKGKKNKKLLSCQMWRMVTDLEFAPLVDQATRSLCNPKTNRSKLPWCLITTYFHDWRAASKKWLSVGAYGPVREMATTMVVKAIDFTSVTDTFCSPIPLPNILKVVKTTKFGEISLLRFLYSIKATPAQADRAGKGDEMDTAGESTKEDEEPDTKEDKETEGFVEVVNKKGSKMTKDEQLRQAAEKLKENDISEAEKRAELVRQKDAETLDVLGLFQQIGPVGNGFIFFTSRLKVLQLAQNVINGLPEFLIFHLEEPSRAQAEQIVAQWLGKTAIIKMRELSRYWCEDDLCAKRSESIADGERRDESGLDWLGWGMDITDQVRGYLQVDIDSADCKDIDDGATVAGAADELKDATDMINELVKDITIKEVESERLHKLIEVKDSEHEQLLQRIAALEAQNAELSVLSQDATSLSKPQQKLKSPQLQKTSSQSRSSASNPDPNKDKGKKKTKSGNGNKTSHAARGDEFGDRFSIRSVNATRIVFQNVGGLPEFSNDHKQKQLTDWLREARVDAALLSEVNLFWPAVKEGNKWLDRARAVNPRGHFSSVAYNTFGGLCSNSLFLQYGGCVAALFNRAAHGAVDRGVDPTGLGRYAWVQIKGRQLAEGEDDTDGEVATAKSKDLILVAGYRPNPSHRGTSTVWIQHKQYFASRNDPIDPRDAFVRDLLAEVIVWRTKGFEVIVGVDANEDLVFDGPTCFRHRLKMAGLEEAIMRQNGDDAPATYQKRESQVPIDGIFVSPGVEIQQAGYLGFLENIHSDHRCLWIDINLKTTLGGFEPEKSHHSSRRLTLMDGKAVTNYIKISESEYLRRNIPSSLAKLVQEIGMCDSLSERQQKRFDGIHNQMYKARRLAERKCRKIRAGGVPWSPRSQELWDRISLWKVLLSAARGIAVSSRRIRRLMSTTHLPDAWKLSAAELEANLKKDRACLKTLKKTGAVNTLRSRFLAKRREWARKRKHSSLHGLSRLERLERMRQREETRRRKKAQGKGSTGGLKAIQIEHTLPNGSIRLITLSDPVKVAEGCMQENRSRYDQTRSPFPTPPMEEPLYSMFTGHEAEANVRALVDGSLDLPPVDRYTQEFLRSCRVPPNLSHQDLSVSVEDHIDFWSKMKENKGSEPNGLHNGHFKAGVKSDLLVQCDTIMRDIPMKTGFSPDAWRNLMNFSIEKQPGEFRLSKMRTIQLMNSELQANNKKVGKAAMQYAEDHLLIPPGQCGSRKAHESIALVISKRLNWDLLRQQRRAAGWISNDAKSCFDRIVHWVGMVALFRFGIPWSVLMMMFGTLQLATHRVRTGFGDHDTPFFPPSWFPFQGCGQGNGAGPTIWVAVSAILIGAMQLNGFGFQFISAISGLLVMADCFCFVDDSDVIEAAKSVESSGEQIFKSVQDAMNLWAAGVRATGGALNPPKCFWYLIDFKPDKNSGEWKYRRIKDFVWTPSHQTWQQSRKPEWIGALLTSNLDGSLVALRQLEPDTAEKTLGVMMCPDDNCRAEYDYLLEKTKNWAEKVRSGRLLKYDVLPMVRSTIMKTVEYPMALTTFSQSEWMKILSPVLMTCLPKAGVCRCFKRLAVFSPLRYQGLGLPHPSVTQLLQHLQMVMKSLSVNSQATAYLRAVLEGHRLESGTSYELFQQEYSNTAILATDTWVKKVWKEMDEYGIHLETDNWDIELFREDDSLLMDLFIDALAPQEELKWLNICRMYLHAMTVSDIVSADGSRVTTDAWNGRRNSSRRSHYNWPRTFRPPETAWNVWRKWLSTTLVVTGSLSRTLKTPLGPWFDDINEWNWVFSPTADALFHRQGHVWVRCLNKSVSPRIFNRSFITPSSGDLFSYAVKSLPPDVKRTTIQINPSSAGSSESIISITGIGEQLSQPEEPTREPSVHAAWKEAAAAMTASYGWVPDKIVIKGDEAYLFECLMAGSLRMVSDGSFKNDMGTAVVQLRPKASGHVIWIYCQTPGQMRDQSAFRSELIGLLAGIMVASWLRSEWIKHFPTYKPTHNPKIHVACDGIEALRQAFIYKSLSPQQPQFDLISSIRHAISDSKIDWIPRHVKGHADKNKAWKKLDWWEKRNCEVDQKATTYRSKLEAEGRIVARNPRFFSEPCALFINGIKESSIKRSKLEDTVIWPQLLNWWEERGRLSRRGAALVDWDIVGRAMKALPDGIQRWCTKHTAGMCAVGTMRLARKLDTSDKCPMCPHPEDHRHVPRCEDARATAEWDKRVSEFVQWSHSFGTAPEITDAFTHCLKQIRAPAHKWQPTWSFGQTVPVDTIDKAYRLQSLIGPQGFLEGLLTSDWADAQQRYFRAKGSRRSGRKWASSVSQHLIMIGFHMWEHRNSVFHSESSRSNIRIGKEIDAEIRRQFRLSPVNLSDPARYELQNPISKVLVLKVRILELTVDRRTPEI